MRTLVLLLLVACWRSPAQRPAPSGPKLLGGHVAIAPLSAEEQMLYERASTSLAQAKLTFRDPSRAWEPKLRAWIDRRLALLRDVEAALQQLPSEQRTALFASIVAGVALDDFVIDATELPMPSDFVRGRDRAEAEYEYRKMLESIVYPVATNARQMLARCSELAPTAQKPLDVWADYCSRRGLALVVMVERVDVLSKRAAPN